MALVLESRFHKKLNFGRKGRNIRNDCYPLDEELPAVRALTCCTENFLGQIYNGFFLENQTWLKPINDAWHLVHQNSQFHETCS